MEVDQVWHQHLVYTASYRRMCRMIGGANCFLDHHPTRGGDSEQMKFEAQYRRTLILLSNCFKVDIVDNQVDVFEGLNGGVEGAGRYGWTGVFQRFYVPSQWRVMNLLDYCPDEDDEDSEDLYDYDAMGCG